MTTTCVLHFASAVPQTVEYHVGHAVLDHGARHLSDQSVIRQEPSVFPPDVSYVVAPRARASVTDDGKGVVQELEVRSDTW